MMGIQTDSTHQSGLTYERFMGRWSRPSGRLFVDWLKIPPHQRWLEVGCGTGAFTEVILSECAPTSIRAFDLSEQQIAYARMRIKDPRVALEVGNAQSIHAAASSFDVAVSALALNFMADQQKAVAEMTRVVRPGGDIAAYVWDFAGRRNITQHLSEAMAAVAPKLEQQARTAQQADTTRPEVLERLFRSAGLDAVETHSLDTIAEFDDIEDYWQSNTSLISPLSAIGTANNELRGGHIDALKAKLKELLPSNRDGKIAFPVRAWAARGVVRAG